MKKYHSPGWEPTPIFEKWVGGTAEQVGLGAITTEQVGLVAILAAVVVVVVVLLLSLLRRKGSSGQMQRIRGLEAPEAMTGR